MFPAKVQDTIDKFGMFDRDQRILVGVSGGADSVCLLLILSELGYSVGAAHLNHGLRGTESDEDEAFTRYLGGRLGVPFYGKRVDIPLNRGNLEANGRQARKDFFAEIVRAQGFDRVALAHNRDDRIETFLLNLFRGSGVEGLVSMEPAVDGLVRPLIESSRSEIECYLQHRSQEWRTDSTNGTRRFARNRLRLDVVPRLASEFNPKLSDALHRTIEILSDEDRLLADTTKRWLAEHAEQPKSERHGTKNAATFVLDAEVLATEPVALQRRVIREVLKGVVPENALRDVSFDHIEAARELLGTGRSGKRVEIPGDLTMTRSFGHLIAEMQPGPAVEFEYRLQIPGEVHIPELERRFSARIVEEEDNGGFNPDRVFVDGCNLGPYVRIRSWKPGDYYRPVGLPAGKLKRLFQRARIPRSQRHRWPIFVADTQIIWVASFPVAREFAPRGCSQKVVAFEALPI